MPVHNRNNIYAAVIYKDLVHLHSIYERLLFLSYTSSTGVC